MIWIETSIVVERVAIEEVAALFEPYGKNGFIESEIDRDEEYVSLVKIHYSDTLLAKEELIKKYIVISFYGEFEDSFCPSIEEWIESIEEKLDENSISYLRPLRAKYINTSDWETAWKDYIEPVHITRDITVVPIWKDYEGKSEEKVIYYDTSNSFGTGSHETTFSCAKLLSLHGLHKKRILDIGTGTGILLFVSHHLSPEAELFGIDIDEEAVTMSESNGRLNNIDCIIKKGDLASVFNGKADLIIANLTVDPLKYLLKEIQDKLENNGILIISGIIDDRYAEIMPYIELDWKIIEHIHFNNWHSFALINKHYDTI